MKRTAGVSVPFVERLKTMDPMRLDSAANVSTLKRLHFLAMRQVLFSHPKRSQISELVEMALLDPNSGCAILVDDDVDAVEFAVKRSTDPRMDVDRLEFFHAAVELARIKSGWDPMSLPAAQDVVHGDARTHYQLLCALGVVALASQVRTYLAKGSSSP